MTQVCRPDGQIERFLHDEANPDFFGRANVLAVELRSSPLPFASRRTIRKFTYDPVYQRLKTVEDEQGSITKLFYDFDRDPILTGLNLEKVRYPDATLSDGSLQRNCIQTWKYDQFGQVIEMLSAEGRKSTVEYHLSGRGAGLPKKTTQHDPDAPLVQQFEYDDLGNLSEMIDGLGNTSVFEYNHLNQLVKTVLPAVNGKKAVFKMEYNADRLLSKEYIPKGSYSDEVLSSEWIINEYIYDFASRLVKTVHFANTANPQTETYIRDVCGNIVKQKNPAGFE